MKKQHLIFLYILFLTNSNPIYGEAISFENIIKLKGLYYEKYKDMPYTGHVKGRKNGRIIEGRISGVWITYFKNGLLNSKINYKNGLKEGLAEYFHENTNLFEKGFHKDGKREGLWVTFFRNGQLSYEKYYFDGVEEGLFNSYSEETGQLMIRGYYKGGRRHGRWEYFDEDGVVEIEDNYKDGKIIDGPIIEVPKT